MFKLLSGSRSDRPVSFREDLELLGSSFRHSFQLAEGQTALNKVLDRCEERKESLSASNCFTVAQDVEWISHSPFVNCEKAYKEQLQATALRWYSRACERSIKSDDPSSDKLNLGFHAAVRRAGVLASAETTKEDSVRVFATEIRLALELFGPLSMDSTSGVWRLKSPKSLVIPEENYLHSFISRLIDSSSSDLVIWLLRREELPFSLDQLMKLIDQFPDDKNVLQAILSRVENSIPTDYKKLNDVLKLARRFFHWEDRNDPDLSIIILFGVSVFPRIIDYYWSASFSEIDWLAALSDPRVVEALNSERYLKQFSQGDFSSKFATTVLDNFLANEPGYSKLSVDALVNVICRHPRLVRRFFEEAARKGSVVSKEMEKLDRRARGELFQRFLRGDNVDEMLQELDSVFALHSGSALTGFFKIIFKMDASCWSRDKRGLNTVLDQWFQRLQRIPHVEAGVIQVDRDERAPVQEVPRVMAQNLLQMVVRGGFRRLKTLRFELPPNAYLSDEVIGTYVDYFARRPEVQINLGVSVAGQSTPAQQRYLLLVERNGEARKFLEEGRPQGAANVLRDRKYAVLFGEAVVTGDRAPLSLKFLAAHATERAGTLEARAPGKGCLGLGANEVALFGSARWRGQEMLASAGFSAEMERPAFMTVSAH